MNRWQICRRVLRWINPPMRLPFRFQFQYEITVADSSMARQHMGQNKCNSHEKDTITGLNVRFLLMHGQEWIVNDEYVFFPLIQNNNNNNNNSATYFEEIYLEQCRRPFNCKVLQRTNTRHSLSGLLHSVNSCLPFNTAARKTFPSF